MGSRGDQIRCTVLIDNEKVNVGKKEVPVLFFLNGKKIVTEQGEYHFLLNSDKPLHPYVGMTDGCSVLAKVRI